MDQRSLPKTLEQHFTHRTQASLPLPPTQQWWGALQMKLINVSRDFWNARGSWYPTWNPDVNNGEDAAMVVDYVRVYEN